MECPDTIYEVLGVIFLFLLGLSAIGGIIVWLVRLYTRIGDIEETAVSNFRYCREAHSGIYEHIDKLDNRKVEKKKP